MGNINDMDNLSLGENGKKKALTNSARYKNKL